MLYREAGQFKTSYAADQAIFPLAQDRIGMAIILAVAFIAIPAVANEYWLQTIMIPFLILSLAALGLNVLTGYAGQLSLGTGGFMAVGAFAAYKFATAFPEMNIIVVFLISGLISAAVGIVFGVPSLRIKGFYLAVATLAAQFFLLWLLVKYPWFYNYDPSGVISAPPIDIFGFAIDTAVSKYMLTLIIVSVLALATKNLVRSHIGRGWMAIRDMDIAAEIIGFRPLTTKLSAFAVSSFLVGVAGAMYAFLYLGSVEAAAFDITTSFNILFMVIVGGLGSVLGSFIGAAFILTLPIFLDNFPRMLGFEISVETVTHLQFMIFGALIIFFLIVEPHGLARLWTITKEKLRAWPFPY